MTKKIVSYTLNTSTKKQTTTSLKKPTIMKQKKIPVCYIITKLELGGAQKVCLSLLHGLKKNAIQGLLISGKEGVLAKEMNKQKNVFLLPSLKRELSLSGILNELRSFFSLIQHVRKLKKKHPNLMVHTHSTKAGLLGRWAAFFAGVRIRVHTVHGFGFHPHQQRFVRWIIIALEWITSLITTHYVCVSSHDVKTGTQLFARFAHKHSIIRAAVDWQQFYRPAQRIADFPQEQPFIFGTVACFKKQKNMFDLLKAFALVHAKQPNSRLELIGDGHLRPQIEAWIAQHNLHAVITLHGWQKTVAPLMLNWHAFVLSSLWEGLPCAVVEARLLKLPVVSYTTGGIADVILHGKNGLLYEQKNWHALAQGMLALTKQKETYHRLCSYKDDLSDFNNEQMIQKHIALYNKLGSAYKKR